MSEHVLIRKLEHLTKSGGGPHLGFAVETRESAGPAHKHGAFPDDVVWLKLHGGLVVGKAKIKIAWVGEYSAIGEVRGRTRGSPVHDVPGFWSGRPKAGYAVVAGVTQERWIEPRWVGPRTYGYEWVVLESDKKRATWLEEKPAPRGGEDLRQRFVAWRDSGA